VDRVVTRTENAQLVEVGFPIVLRPYLVQRLAPLSLV
jgi:hypothetical protein